MPNATKLTAAQEEIFSRLRIVIACALKLAPKEVKPDSDLYELSRELYDAPDLGEDLIAMGVETEFDVEIDPLRLDSLQMPIDYIKVIEGYPEASRTAQAAAERVWNQLYTPKT